MDIGKSKDMEKWLLTKGEAKYLIGILSREYEKNKDVILPRQLKQELISLFYICSAEKEK